MSLPMTSSPPSVAVYVSSFDGYEDVWPVFFAAFFKHWPDCPWPIYLGSNQKTFHHPSVKGVYADNQLSWSQQLQKHLMQIDEAYILFILDDFMLKAPVSTPWLLKLSNVVQRLQIAALKVRPVPYPKDSISGWPDLGAYGPHQQLRTSAHPTIWRKQDLLNLLVADESIWQFEINGAVRAAHLPLCCAVKQNAMPYEHAITQKKWFPWSAWKFQRAGFPIDLKVRGVLPWKNAAFYLLHRKSGPFLRWLVPLALRQKLLRLVMPNKYRHS